MTLNKEKKKEDFLQNDWETKENLNKIFVIISGENLLQDSCKPMILNFIKQLGDSQIIDGV